MSKVKLGDVVVRIKDSVDRNNTDLLYYIGGEHFDERSLTVTRKGIIKGSTIGPAFSTKFRSGDVLLMSRNPHLRKAGMVNFEGICSDVSYIIRTRDENVIMQKFIPILFQSDAFWTFAEKNKKGSTNFFLNWSDFERFEFDLPDHETQEKLCKTLWAINDTLDSYKEMLKQSDELVKAKFVEMFGNTAKAVKLTDYVWFQEGPGVRSVDFADEGTILLTGSNINNNKISFGYNSDRYISTKLSSGKYAHFMCDKNDILAVTSAIAPSKFDEKITIVEEDKKYCLNTGIIRFKPNLKYLTREYFKEFMKSDYFKSQVSEKMTGVCQMHFGPSHLKKMTLLLPTNINEQNKFGVFTDKINKSKSYLQGGITKLEILYKKIVNQYLTKEENE